MDINPTFGVFFMAKYDKEVKQTIVQEYLTGASGYKVLAAKFGVHRITIRGWARQYHEGGLDALEPRTRGRPKKMKTPEAPLPTPVQAQDAR